MARWVTRIACFVAFTAIACAAPAAVSDWSPADESEMRVFLSNTSDGQVLGGVELRLEPGWYTYWRYPGEAGVPPVFDFSGSKNVARVEVLYPAPERYDDGVSVSLVYHDGVVFPLEITPTDSTLPVSLRVELSFGVCSVICVPTDAASEVEQQSPAKPDPLATALLDRYTRLVPQAPEPGRLDVEAVTQGPDALLIDVRAPDSVYSDLFVEAPQGWFIGQPVFVSRSGGISSYRLSLAGRPEDDGDGATLHFVAVAGGDAIEESVDIE